jgi:predicted metalloprotease
MMVMSLNEDGEMVRTVHMTGGSWSYRRSSNHSVLVEHRQRMRLEEIDRHWLEIEV